MENVPSDIRPLSTPSSYRATNPAVLSLPPVTEKMRLFERKRLMIGFAIAAALHVTLVVGWWLTPPLRLKASYAPERWVQLLPLPKPATAAPATSQPEHEPAVTGSKKKSKKSHKTTAPIEAPAAIH